MENQIVELREHIQQLCQKIEFLEAELECVVRSDLATIDSVHVLKRKNVKGKEKEKEKEKAIGKRMVGYKVVKIPSSETELLEDIVNEHLLEGWMVHEGLCFADKHLCQALVKYSTH